MECPCTGRYGGDPAVYPGARIGAEDYTPEITKVKFHLENATENPFGNSSTNPLDNDNPLGNATDR